MQYIISNNGTQWILDFGPDSIVFNVKDLDENIAISFMELPLAVLSLLQSQRQAFCRQLLASGFPKLPTNKDLLKREKKYSPVLEHKFPTQGDTSYPI